MGPLLSRMPLADYACPNCEGCLHTDDLIEGECVTPGCGEEFPPGFRPREDLPEYEGGNKGEHTVEGL